MDQNWSAKNREIQTLLDKEASFREAIEKLIAFRAELFGEMTQYVGGLPTEAFSRMPFPGAAGYHSKTLAYSMWHIFRIEDITAHEMIGEDQQILFAQGFSQSIHAPILTTGNELTGEEIVRFSRQLDLRQLHRYGRAVMDSTNEMMAGLTWCDLKRKFGGETAARLRASRCVNEDEAASWLVDYWCGKDVGGLIKMPFSRHWIMHMEAMRRIKNRLCKLARKGVDPIARCGFSCNHCFLGAWCGSCRTEYNLCSYAASAPDGICPNVRCCEEKGIDGCYDCPGLEACETGFYVPSNDGAGAAKAQALYIRKNGKKAFLALHDRLHEKYNFAKTQEILGRDPKEGLRFLEEN